MECKACGYIHMGVDHYRDTASDEFIMINEPITIAQDEYGNPQIEKQMYICPKCGIVRVEL